MADFCVLILKIANSPVLAQFLHDCVDELTKTKEANFDNYNSDIEWTVHDFNETKKCIQNFYRESVVHENFNLPSNLPKNVQEEITNCFNIRKDDIFEALVKESLIGNGHKLVENFDWKLKWVLGSSKLASIREPLLQVDLHCEDQQKTVNFELNLSKLDLLIEQLERVKSEIKRL